MQDGKNPVYGKWELTWPGWVGMRSSAIYEDSKKLQWNVATQHKARNDIDYFTTRAQNDYVYIQTGTMRL